MSLEDTPRVGRLDINEDTYETSSKIIQMIQYIIAGTEAKRGPDDAAQIYANLIGGLYQMRLSACGIGAQEELYSIMSQVEQGISDEDNKSKNTPNEFLDPFLTSVTKS